MLASGSLAIEESAVRRAPAGGPHGAAAAPERIRPDARLSAVEAEALTVLLRGLGRSIGGAAPGPEVVAALTAPDALGAFADQVVAHALTAPEGLATFVGALETSHGSSAATDVLRARLAEWRGELIEAEALTDRALRRDPRHVVALRDAAQYASARGRAEDARRMLHRAGADDEPLAVLLARLAPSPRTRPGRNQPCGCGSGRKHKHCCLGTSGLPLAERTAWVHRKALDHAVRPPQRRHLLAVASAHAGGDTVDEPPPEAVLAAACDPLVTDLLLWEGGGLRRFLATWGPLLPPDEATLVERWASLRHRLWERTDERPSRDPNGPVALLAVVDDDGPGPTFVTTARPVPTPLIEPLRGLLARCPDALELAGALGAGMGWTAGPDHEPSN